MSFDPSTCIHDYYPAVCLKCLAPIQSPGEVAALAEVERLKGELAELRSQANEYGRHPFPTTTVASSELEADLETIRLAMNGHPGKPDRWAALSRVAAALGVRL